MTRTAAPVYELVIPQKHTLQRVWRKRMEDGTYFDFTGYTVRGSVRASYEEGAELYLDLEPYLEVATTRINLLVPNDITAPLAFNVAVWDMVTEAPDGVVERFLQGPASLDPGVTP